MTLFVPSVYHTGVRFCRESLFSDFKFESQVLPNPEATSIHIEPTHIKVLQHWLNEAEHIVVPLRHPSLVARSWKLRNYDMDALDEQWRMLASVVAPYDPIYMPVDHPDRSLYLDALNERMGLELQTDWQPVGYRLPHEVINDEPLTDDELDQAEYWSYNLPMVREIYG